ncbi:thiamine pyrophosphate-dependent dehydrogenase E1 component subunit alpha [Bifidobacterium sp. SO4]|uniref:thiamine pyrophosphate-dependent dehydrogenase E1 component subunit alpha n=1 Tax=Bifidobacterium sp. SO4 TaxID=2809030 RepID=UPI001BDC0CF8|nr:thiamine pyrophosphate-dependent dehydrogenase E1 component subunit alpha [Bifidobacterium sp. SO4]MBT1170937.1 thiamine pyrophosphate-dependent dehydrogenase E1 component subunit alpha [Bifidobacterium sp. SO4]
MNTSQQINAAEAAALYRSMRRIRRFEQTVKELSGTEILGPAHLYIGEEAVAVGVCANLTAKDYVTSTHRGHGHTLAKGAAMNRSFAELFGRATGYCKGKGGSMHLADFSVGMLGANGVVGGGFNIATGAALAIRQRHANDVAVCFFGDGASSRGTFHEAVNLAASWKLPVIYVCENNQWASTTRFDDIKNVDYLSQRAQGYGIPGITVDGNDVLSVRNAASHLIERARSGKGPSILECRTYRIDGHFITDPQAYRSQDEVREYKLHNDPIDRFTERMRLDGILTDADFAREDAAVEQELSAALEFARNSPYPQPSEALDDVYVQEEHHE